MGQFIIITSGLMKEGKANMLYPGWISGFEVR